MVILIGGKRAWIRILEVVVAILLLSSVLIYITVKNQISVQNEQLTQRVSDLQDNLLQDISSSESLRIATLESNYSILSDYISANLDNYFNYSIGICELTDSICPPQFPYSQTDVLGDIFVKERIISSTLQKYDPKVLRLYIWGD